MKTLLYLMLALPLYTLIGFFSWWCFLSFVTPVSTKLIDVTPVSVVPGKEMTVTGTVKWERSCSFTETIYLVDGTVTVLEQHTQYNKKNGARRESVSVTIPQGTHNGNFYVVLEIIPRCNPYDYIFPTPYRLQPIPIVVDDSPVKLMSLRLEKDKVKRHEPLVLISRFERRRQCLFTLERYIETERGDIIEILKRDAGARALGVHTVKGKVRLRGLRPGNYKLRSVVKAICPTNTYSMQHDPIKFSVLP